MAANEDPNSSSKRKRQEIEFLMQINQGKKETMYRKTIATAVAGLLILGLGACGNASDAKTADAGSAEPIADDEEAGREEAGRTACGSDRHVGKQTNSGSTDSWMEAEITADTITVQWVSDNGDTKSLYWKGSYNAPDKAGDWKWTSQGRHRGDAGVPARLAGRHQGLHLHQGGRRQLGDHRDGHHHSGEDRQAVNYDPTRTL